MSIKIDWSQIPEGFDFAAQGADGDIFAYKSKPNSDDEGCWGIDKKYNHFMESLDDMVYVGRGEPAWKDTLQERPKDNHFPKTKDEVDAQFRQELHDLLNKYGADLEANDEYTGYAECGHKIRMTVCIPAMYDSKNNLVRENVDVDLGRYFSGE